MRRSLNPDLDRLTAVVRRVARIFYCRDGTIVQLRCLISSFVISILCFAGALFAQPPGTQPPQGLLDGAREEKDSGVPIRAFMFLSESGNPVMMPSLTWEEFERYLSLDSGLETARRKFTYQSLELTGMATGPRAELSVRLKLAIDSTEGGWVTIPIKLGNFHQIEPISLEPPVEAITTVTSDGQGYRLFVKHDSRVEIDLVMRVSARVDFASNYRSLRFQLPDVPSRINLIVERDTANAEVIGQGDEIVELVNSSDTETALKVESSGGDYTLRWSRSTAAVEPAPIYEVESRTSMRWNSPQDQPTATVRLSINNLRGSVQQFSLRLPPNAILLDSPIFTDTGFVLDASPSEANSEQMVSEITIPNDMRQQRVDLTFEYQLKNQEASSESPMQLMAPDVIGALRHRGEVEIITPSEYRLRWKSAQWVRNLFENAANQAGTDRTYRFGFERPQFVLPVWLSENQRQLRVNTRSELTTRDRNATLWMQVEISGETDDGLLRFDDAGWEIRIVESQLGTPLLTFEEDQFSVVDLTALSNEEASQLIFQFQRVLQVSQNTAPIFLTLPRIVIPEKEQVIRDSTFNLVNDGRMAFVLDLEESQGLNRTVALDSSGSANSEIRSYRLIDGEQAAMIVGNLIEQPTRITLTSDLTVELDGDLMSTTCDWVVSSLLDLEGRLSLRIPFVNPSSKPPAVVERGENVESLSVSDLKELPENLSVTVDDLPAKLQFLEGDRYLLISDRLTSGTMKVRFRNQIPIDQANSENELLAISVPRPAVADMTLRGPVVVNLVGDDTRSLSFFDKGGLQSLELSQIPKDSLRLSIKPREEEDTDQKIERTIVRSLIGSTTRYEQVLARVSGGDSYELKLTVDPTQVSVNGFVDGKVVRVRLNGNSLSVPLVNQDKSQLIDLRIRYPQEPNNFAIEVTPLVTVNDPTLGSYWQIIAPRDSHAVWASSMLGREMSWRYNRWNLYRDPIYGDQSLLDLVSASMNSMPSGNRYLYRGFEPQAFRVILVSRVALWMAVGSFVILLSVGITCSRVFRHPVVMVTLLMLLAGICVLSPDAVILAGQYGLLALVLLVVMIAVKGLLKPNSRRRLFSDSAGSRPRSFGSKIAKPSSLVQTLELVIDEEGVSGGKVS